MNIHHNPIQALSPVDDVYATIALVFVIIALAYFIYWLAERHQAHLDAMTDEERYEDWIDNQW